MDILRKHSSEDLHKTLLAEIAKAKSEINCAQGDINKAHSRLNFLIALSNELINRDKD